MAEVIAERLRSAFGLAPAPTLYFERRITVEVKVTIPAGAAVNSTLIPSFTVDPRAGATTEFKIPKGYRFVLVDAYIKSSEDVPVDGILRLKRNYYYEVSTIGPVSTMLVSNPTRPAVAAAVWDEGDSLTMEFNNIVAGGSAAQTDTMYLVFDVYSYY